MHGTRRVEGDTEKSVYFESWRLEFNVSVEHEPRENIT